MTDSVLGVLKIALLALLYLFFARVLWAVWSEVRGPRVGRAPIPEASPTVPTARPDVAPAPPTPSRRKRGAVSKLTVLEPKHRKGAAFDVTAEITIGRSVTATISIPDDAFVSQLHARLYQTEAGTVVEDLASTNGSFLNGARFTGSQTIVRGDRLQVGSVVLEAR